MKLLILVGLVERCDVDVLFVMVAEPVLHSGWVNGCHTELYGRNTIKTLRSGGVHRVCFFRQVYLYISVTPCIDTHEV